jgi:hypothetical protein
VLQSVLRRLGYFVDAQVIDPLEHGELTGRRRAVVIANMEPVRWPEKLAPSRTIGDTLDPEPHAWFTRDTKARLFEHWDKQTATPSWVRSWGRASSSARCDASSRRSSGRGLRSLRPER